MARPIHADATATRRRILDVAFSLFSDHGAGDVGLRQIAREAGVSMATVHHYYGSKNDLYRACVDSMFDALLRLRGELEPAFTTARNIDEAIDLSIRRTYAFARRHRSAVQLLMRTVLDTGELDPAHRDRVLLPFLDRGAALLSPLLGQPGAAIRLTLLSITYLIVRFVLNSPEELGRITGHQGGSIEEGDEIVAEYLVTAARALLSRQSTQVGEP